MKKIIVTESQAKLLGANTIKENSNSESGIKTSGSAIIGPKPLRIVISGPDVSKLKDIIIKIVKKQDPETTVAYYEATGKIVGNVSEYKLNYIKRDLTQLNPNISVEKKPLAKSLKENQKNIVKITKEQYNKLVESGLIKEEQEIKVKGGLARVDKAFKKEFAKHDIQNLKKESKFNITKPNPSLPKSIQGRFGVSEMSDLMKETKNLIEYMYGKTQEFPPFWNKFGLTYEEICEALLNEGMIVENDGCLKLSKSLGEPDMAINTVMEKLNEIINDGRELEMESDGYLPSGAESDPTAPWKQTADLTKPITPKNPEFVVTYYNSEMAILKDKSGELYFFMYDFIPRKDFADYAEMSRTYVGRDEEGFPVYDYDDDWEIDGYVISGYVNDNVDSFTYGFGIDGFDTGKDLVKIDDELKDYLLRLYDKDKNLINILGSINEMYSEEADYDEEESRRKMQADIDRFKADVKKAVTPSGEKAEPKTKEEIMQMAKLFAKLYNRPVSHYLEKLNKKYGIEETTTAASSGSYTGPFLGKAAEVPEDPNKLDVPVVGETTAGSASIGAYDANALPNIARDGSFKKKGVTPKAFKKTQYPKGGFVKFNDCVKLNNKPAGAGCSQGAVDNVVKVVQTKGNINAPSLNESMMYEALKLQYDKKDNRLIVISDLEGRAASQETFTNKAVLKQNGFVWTGTNWAIPADKLDVAKKTLTLINKAEYLIDKLEDLEDAVEDSGADNKSLLKSKLEQYISDLANATDEAALSGEIRRYLTFFSKFHSYSFYNRMLIYIQKPDATKVASYRTWQSKFRQVNKGAKAITVLAPIISKTDKDVEGDDNLTSTSDVRGFRAVNVFDISDTTPIDERGEVPQEPQWWGDNTPSETADMLFDAVTEIAKDMGIKVTQSDAKGGEKGFSAGDHINLSSDVSGAGRLSTMIHEIAHELMHWKKSSIYYIDNGEGKEKRQLQELQAESVSYVVLKHYGIPVSHHSTYLALWKANKEKIQNNLEIISKVSQFIINKIDAQISEGK